MKGKKKWMSLALTAAMMLSMASPAAAAAQPMPLAEEDDLATYVVSEDLENKAAYADLESGVAAEFDWYRWDFAIDPDIDTVGEVGDGVGTIYFRLFTPETKAGEKYPVMLYLGGLSSTNSNAGSKNGYAAVGTYYASDVMQAENPGYVLTFSTPYEACVNYEAELEYVYQYGEVAKWVAETYGNVDMDRIYASGHSQGAGWSYELAGVQPDLLAGAIINAGTTVHTTWGDQCDMEAIAASDVNLYIWHGYNDPFIPVNDAYRAYNTLAAMGKTNMIMEIADGLSVNSWIGHVSLDIASATEITPYMEWLYAQKKGVPCVQEPVLTEEDDYSVYQWAGYLAFEGMEGWQTANDYANWVEPFENATWDELKEQSNDLVEGDGGTGKTVLAKVRIGDETSTQYDADVKTITAGDTVAVTVQGYTGGYGDDWYAFNQEWDVDWAILSGDVTDIDLTCEASDEPILRPASVSLANGGGPNVNNSLYTEDALDGQQVYVKIDTAEDFVGNELKVALRFTRWIGGDEYASYTHVVTYTVEEKPAYPSVSEDLENMAEYADLETGDGQYFDWYRWDFEIDPAMDTVGKIGDGIGTIFFRLFTPEVERGEKYPMMLYQGGLGSTNSNASSKNGYAAVGTYYASDVMQEENPSYVLTFSTPYEACVNYEAELAYVYQYGEIAKWVASTYNNVDMDRIYASGHSQGAGWSYELAAVQPDLLAAAIINAGTTIHTTWGDQCDMEAIAASDVNLYIWHGYNDPFIPVNDAYRAFNTLKKLGKKNMVMEIADGFAVNSWIGHVSLDIASATEITPYMEWLYAQKKGVPCVEEPVLNEADDYSVYKWAGYLVFPQIEGWQTANDYAHWVEPFENKTWDAVKAGSAFASGKGGTGKTVLGKIRIGDETSTQYDTTQTIQAGDVAAITVQGYTGGYGDDWDAFNDQWSVDWAVLEGDVTNIELTHAASAKPILRPASVTLANGGGPNVNNSLYTENALDGKQVYVKIDTAEDFAGDSLKVAIRFTRKVGDAGEFASYYHVVEFTVEPKAPETDKKDPVITTIADKTVIEKAYGDKAFYLKTRTNSDGQITYTSSDAKVAKVGAKGKVYIKGTGVATITINIEATETYAAAQKIITLKVAPGKGSISKAKVNKKQLDVTVKKDVQATGYQVQVSTDVNFAKKKTTTVTMKKNSKVTATLKNLKAGTYYVRTRSYKTADGKKLYGEYSKIKVVVVK